MKRFNKASRYPKVGNKYLIEIKLHNIHQLYDQRDPSPFREKDLDDDAVDYIVSSTEEITKDKVEKLVIFLNLQDELINKESVIASIHSFFEYEAETTRKVIRRILNNGFKSLFIGLGFLIIATGVALALPKDGSNFVENFFKEGFALIGWVSMWKPVNIFLYEWWPYLSRKRVYEKLAEIPIDILP